MTRRRLSHGSLARRGHRWDEVCSRHNRGGDGVRELRKTLGNAEQVNSRAGNIIERRSHTPPNRDRRKLTPLWSWRRKRQLQAARPARGRTRDGDAIAAGTKLKNRRLSCHNLANKVRSSRNSCRFRQPATTILDGETETHPLTFNLDRTLLIVPAEAQSGNGYPAYKGAGKTRYRTPRWFVQSKCLLACMLNLVERCNS